MHAGGGDTVEKGGRNRVENAENGAIPLAIGGLSGERTVAGGVAVGFGVLVSSVGVAGVVDEIDVRDERPGPQAGVPRVGRIERPTVHVPEPGEPSDCKHQSAPISIPNGHFAGHVTSHGACGGGIALRGT